jgi:hypothetical protein
VQYFANVLQQNKVVLPLLYFIIHVAFLMQTLTRLDLSANKIDDRGVEYLANALQQNQVMSRTFHSFIHYLFYTGAHQASSQPESNW